MGARQLHAKALRCRAPRALLREETSKNMASDASSLSCDQQSQLYSLERPQKIPVLYHTSPVSYQRYSQYYLVPESFITCMLSIVSRVSSLVHHLYIYVNIYVFMYIPRFYPTRKAQEPPSTPATLYVTQQSLIFRKKIPQRVLQSTERALYQNNVPSRPTQRAARAPHRRSDTRHPPAPTGLHAHPAQPHTAH